MTDLKSLLDQFDEENPGGKEIVISPDNIDAAMGNPSVLVPLLSDPDLMSDLRQKLHSAFGSTTRVDTRDLAIKLEVMEMPDDIRAALKASIIEVGRRQ